MAKSKKEKAAEKAAAAKAKAEAKERVKAEQEAKEEADAAAKAQADAELLSVPQSKVKLAGFKAKKGVTPEMIEKEEARHAGLIKKRTANRVAAARAKAKEKKVDARRKLLVARLTKIRNKRQATNYSQEQIKVWVEELEFINKTPKAWKPGCIKAKGVSLEDKVAAVLRGK